MSAYHRSAAEFDECEFELDHEFEVDLDLECTAGIERGIELDSGCGPEVDLDHECGLELDLLHAQPQSTQLVGPPEVDLDHKWGLGLDLVHAQPRLTQFVGQQQWKHLLDYQELEEGQDEAASVGPAGVVVTISVCHALDGASLEDTSLDAAVPRGLPPNAELAVR